MTREQAAAASKRFWFSVTGYNKHKESTDG